MNFVRNLTLRQLQIFVVAARHLSYARAAEELHLTPPAVSMQLKQLDLPGGGLLTVYLRDCVCEVMQPVKQLIAFRKVDTGMTREMVIAAWGEPYHKSEVKKEGRTLETLRFSDNRYVELLDGEVQYVRIY